MEPFLFLARQWQQLLSAPVALVHVEDAHRLGVTWALSGDQGHVHFLMASADTSADDICNRLAEMAPAELGGQAEFHAIPLTWGSTTRGWIVASQIVVPPKWVADPPIWLPQFVNLTAERLAVWSQFETAKLASLEQFAAGAGHEINNPIATISGRVQQLLRVTDDPDHRQALITIGGQALRVRDMIGDLMLFAQPPTPKPQRLEFGPFITDILERFSTELTARHIQVVPEISPGLVLWADQCQCAVVVSELLENALEAIGNSGRICIQAARATETLVVFSVKDDGAGIPGDVRPHLFDPFFSGRQAGRGLGFGLSKCWRIITGHGGTIRVPPSTDGWTTFEVHWPSAERKTKAEPPKPDVES